MDSKLQAIRCAFAYSPTRNGKMTRSQRLNIGKASKDQMTNHRGSDCWTKVDPSELVEDLHVDARTAGCGYMR